jgi:hypothetical protein
MCGRFTNEMTWAELDALYSIYNSALPPSHMPPRYNIARTQSVYFAHTDKAGALQVDYDPVATLADIEPAPPLQVGDLRGPPTITFTNCVPNEQHLTDRPSGRGTTAEIAAGHAKLFEEEAAIEPLIASEPSH